MDIIVHCCYVSYIPADVSFDSVFRVLIQILSSITPVNLIAAQMFILIVLNKYPWLTLQLEYIQGISAWNFDLADLKKQAALVSGSIPAFTCAFFLF